MNPKWRTIESAPTKCGEEILAYNSDSDYPKIHKVFYSNNNSATIHKWRKSSAPMDFVVGLTHWMPLPKIPQSK